MSVLIMAFAPLLLGCARPSFTLQMEAANIRFPSQIDGVTRITA
jgi:hypothetical protein